MSRGKVNQSTYKKSTERNSLPLPSSWKEHLLLWPPTRVIWSKFRAYQVEKEYENRREHYARLAAESNIVYKESDVISSVRKRISNRGHVPKRRRIGEVHTFASFPLYSWHQHLLPDLRVLGPVSHFDYTALGFSVEQIAKADKKGSAQRQEMVKHIIPALRAAHEQRPVDWVFFYGGGQDVSPTVVSRITEEFGIPTVNMSLDDKQGWAGRYNNECRKGAIDITSDFDLFMTSARVACKWHLVEGGRPIYLPEGFNVTAFHPKNVKKDIPVSFVGSAYGPRIPIVRYLQRHGIDVYTFGNGWPKSRWVDDIDEVYNRSLINLGIGGIEYSENLTNVKGRDFEVPGSGGGVYLTSFNPDLAQHFAIGEEILCYRNRDEMLEIIRYYLNHPEEAEEISSRARTRCLREHRWLHRYKKFLTILGILEE